jgi:hypothetical protein
MQAAFRLASFQPDEEKYRSVLSDRKGESPVQQPLNTHKPFGYASRRPLLIGR